VFEPFVKSFRDWYRGRVGTELRKYGLRLEDLYDPEADVVSSTCTDSQSEAI